VFDYSLQESILVFLLTENAALTLSLTIRFSLLFLLQIG
jgi:hypothetical protein